MYSYQRVGIREHFLPASLLTEQEYETCVPFDENDLSLVQATYKDMVSIMMLEKKGFARGIREEASTFESRLSVFADGFWLLKLKGRTNPVGYICTEIWDCPEGESLKNTFAINHSPSDVHTSQGNTLYISSQTIDPEFRGKKLGEHMFKSAIAQISALYPHIRKHLLIVNEDWGSARKIYLKEGFSDIGKIDGFFHAENTQPKAALIMLKHYA